MPYFGGVNGFSFKCYSNGKVLVLKGFGGDDQNILAKDTVMTNFDIVANRYGSYSAEITLKLHASELVYCDSETIDALNLFGDIKTADKQNVIVLPSGRKFFL